jgi:aspartate oxidase
LKQLIEIVRNSASSGKNETDYQRIRLENDLLVAFSWIRAAEIRQDSCGCHQRSDYPELPEEIYRTEVRMNDKKIEVFKVMTRR